jgi:4-hydroxy-tetrahydrodipicolinate synthase
VEITIDETAGRVPVVIGVTASCAPLAVEFSRHAEKAGADFLMAMPPFVQRATDAEIRTYYTRIHDSTNLPIIIQNYAGPGGTPMQAAFLAQLLSDLERVQYVKEETEFSGMMITAVQEAAGGNLKGVMGGKAGRHLLEEHRRGVCGTMPACEVSDLHAKLWDELETGRSAEAQETYQNLLPLLLFETSYGVAVYKEVLRRRGIIESAYHRQSGGRVLDAGASEELTRILEVLRPMMTSKYPLVA